MFQNIEDNMTFANTKPWIKEPECVAHEKIIRDLSDASVFIAQNNLFADFDRKYKFTRHLQSSVGTALARASIKITQLVTDVLPAALNTRPGTNPVLTFPCVFIPANDNIPAVPRDILIILVRQSYICKIVQREHA